MRWNRSNSGQKRNSVQSILFRTAIADYHRPQESSIKELDGRGDDEEERGPAVSGASGKTSSLTQGGPEEPPPTDSVLPEQESNKLVEDIEAARSHPTGKLLTFNLKQEDFKRLEGAQKRPHVKSENKSPEKKSKNNGCSLSFI